MASRPSDAIDESTTDAIHAFQAEHTTFKSSRQHRPSQYSNLNFESNSATMHRIAFVLSFVVLGVLTFSVSSFAQEQLPRQEPEFKGKIGLTYKDSTPVKPKLKIPQNFGIENAPNILLVLIDDCGFGQMSTFGGGIPTPAMDRVARNGLRYNRFHTTALCSPTRAALLTGRNHHSVGSGVIGEAGTGFPGYSGIIPQSTATFAEVLRDYGYMNA